MKKNKESQQPSKDHSASEELKTNTGREDASPSRGGTTDLKTQPVGNRSSSSTRGSGISTKRNVTGSDYDGQVSE